MSSPTYKRSHMLVMPSEVIFDLIEDTSCAARKIASAIACEVAPETIIILQFNIPKPREECLSHHIRVYIPPMVRSFHKQLEKELLHILAYVQILELVNVCHSLDIDVLAA